VYKGFLATRKIDVHRGAPFDTELIPRIGKISPSSGSLAGGTDLTVSGSGFGSRPHALTVTVGELACDVTTIMPTYFVCRVQPLSDAEATEHQTRPTPTSALGGLASYPAERGARWQWASATGDCRGIRTRSRACMPKCAF
jgi:hypothetical protein